MARVFWKMVIGRFSRRRNNFSLIELLGIADLEEEEAEETLDNCILDIVDRGELL